MGDNEIIQMVFGILGSSGFVVLFFISFKLFYGYLIQEKRCTAKTTGIVKKYAVGDVGGGCCLPKVYYIVGNKEYRVIGPRYRYIKPATISTPFSNNEMEFYETEDQGFVIRRKSNSIITINRNPMAILYPIGSEIDVYYDPDNPKTSYVLRYCNKKYAFWLTFITAIALLIIVALLLLLL